ncbi:MAG TPA: nuclear transport factor 2 family protein [Candidatus Dormibacteraeota bacterium]|jgi:ketosteroid isomerase-like protein
MSQENVEIVRRYFEHLDQLLAHYWANPVPISQYPLLEEAFNAIAPEAEWKPPFMGKPVRGRDAWLALVSGWLEAADDWRIKVEDVSDLGGEHVLCVSQNSIRGKDSGLAVDQRIFTLVTVRKGQIAAISDFTERRDALEAAGLRE